MVTIRMNIISRILHLFSACFADYTHPREGTETFSVYTVVLLCSRLYSSPRGDGNSSVRAALPGAERIILIPARGRKPTCAPAPNKQFRIILIPARGRKRFRFMNTRTVRTGLYSSPRGDGNRVCGSCRVCVDGLYSSPRGDGNSRLYFLYPYGDGLYSSPRGDGN